MHLPPPLTSPPLAPLCYHGSMSTHQVLSPLQPQNLGTIPTDRLIASLRYWQRRYLMLLQTGVPTEKAARYANVNGGIVNEWSNPSGRRYDAAFARACQLVEQGVNLFGAAPAKEEAAAFAGAMVLEAVEDSRSERTRDNARVANRRLVLEAGGVIQHGVQVAVQVNNGVRAWEAWGAKQGGASGAESTLEAEEGNDEPPG